jgi:hypothetical protein
VGELHVCFDEGAELVPATEVCYCTRAETTEVKVVGIEGTIVGGWESGRRELGKLYVIH